MSASPKTETVTTAEPLRLPPERMGWTAMFFVLFGVLTLGGILGACAWFTAPVVVSDWQVRETAQPAPQARLSEGKCSTKLVIHICDVTLNLRTAQGSVTRRVNYVFAGLHAGDYGVGVMADPARPNLVTTDLGLERLWNRTITLLVLMGALAACIYGALLSVIRNRRATG